MHRAHNMYLRKDNSCYNGTVTHTSQSQDRPIPSDVHIVSLMMTRMALNGVVSCLFDDTDDHRAERAFLLEWKQSLGIATFGFRESDSCPEQSPDDTDKQGWSAIWMWSEGLDSACDFGGVVCDSDGRAVSM